MPVEQGLPWHPVATGLAGQAIPFVVAASHAHALPSPPFWFPVLVASPALLLLVCCARPRPSWCGSRVLCVCVAPPPVCWHSRVPLLCTHSCPTRLPPPYADFTSPYDVDCPACGWLVTALLPPPWQAPPGAPPSVDSGQMRALPHVPLPLPVLRGWGKGMALPGALLRLSTDSFGVHPVWAYSGGALLRIMFRSSWGPGLAPVVPRASECKYMCWPHVARGHHFDSPCAGGVTEVVGSFRVNQSGPCHEQWLYCRALGSGFWREGGKGMQRTAFGGTSGRCGPGVAHREGAVQQEMAVWSGRLGRRAAHAQ